MLVTQLVEQVHRLGEVPLREPVGEGVVVDVGVELVRPHDLAELIPRAADRRFDAVDPEAAGLEEDLGADVAQERGVPGRLDVPDDPVGDVGRDVDLLLTGPEPVGAVGGELRALLPTGVRGLPGVARAPGAVLAGVRPRAVQGVVAVAQ